MYLLDGDHSREGVLRDLAVVEHFLKEDGIVLLHDVWWDAEPPPVDGPLRDFEELGGCVINMTHMGVLERHAANL